MAEMKFTKTHEWVCFDGDIAYVGITDYAQQEMGDLVYVNLPEVDAEVTAGEPFCEVESVKAVAEVNAPVSGTVAEVNEELLDAPEKINEAPYESWIAKIANAGDTDSLLTEDEYTALLEEAH